MLLNLPSSVTLATKLHSENGTFGLHKCDCEARNPDFWVGAVCPQYEQRYESTKNSGRCKSFTGRNQRGNGRT